MDSTFSNQPHPDSPDAVQSSTASAFPAPSDLGLLRFERLDDPSWAMLYLDAACETHLGQSAADLCSLTGFVFASLMEPAARQRLHEQIRAQLSATDSYRVRYHLHSLHGVLEITELGRSYQQFGRPLLQGYLVVGGVVAEAGMARLQPALHTQPELLEDYRQHLCRARAQQGLIDRLARHRYGADATLEAARLITEAACAAFSVRSASLWLLEQAHIVPLIRYHGLRRQHEQADALAAARHPDWLETLQAARVIDIGDTASDPRCGSRRAALQQQQITALLEAGIRNGGELIGMLSLEHAGEPRQWHLDEIAFAGELADHFAQVVANQRRLDAQQHIEQLACTDNLTGLLNRVRFIQHLEQRFSGTPRPSLLLLLVDIDNFKRINDSLGHHIGDKLLAKLARRLTRSLDQRGLVARLASNEFAVLLDDLDQEGGLRLAQHVLRTLDRPIYIENQLISISASVGLACTHSGDSDPQTLLKHAGLALHQAKANGKHQVQVFTQRLNAEAELKLFLENSLRRALAQEELELFYQPKVCLRSGRLLGLEALLRWNHPEKGMIRPDQFIGVAEDTGLIIPIGKWVARQACRMARDLMDALPGELRMAINLSPRQFSDPALVSGLAAILQEERLPAPRLELELTESLLLDATETTRQQLAELKAMGMTLAMDDFGTGYSSLSYLKKFPIDVIKIDRSFVKDIPDNQDDMEITSAVIAMARNLRLKVVAEGIETSEQLAFLRKHHCDIGQGFLFDRPIRGSLLLEELKRYRLGSAET